MYTQEITITIQHGTYTTKKVTTMLSFFVVYFVTQSLHPAIPTFALETFCFYSL